MKTLKLTVNNEDETIQLGKKIGKSLVGKEIISLSGTLGSGKTYLTKGIALGLEIHQDITSPTFTLISEYEGRLPFYHMDVYRLDSSEDFLDLGVDDLLFGEGVCVIEWAEKVEDALPETTIKIYIDITGEQSREIIFENLPTELELKLKNFLSN